MSEEEKKAIEFLKEEINLFHENYGYKITTENINCYEIILNLIEKQQKELEELKQENKEMLETITEKELLKEE